MFFGSVVQLSGFYHMVWNRVFSMFLCLQQDKDYVFIKNQTSIFYKQ
jgi:hypothetical protein